MKKLMVILAIIVSFAWMPTDTHAQSVSRTFTWSLPTTRVDGTPITPAELASIRLYCNGAFVIAVGGSQTSMVQTFNPGTYDCHVTAVDSQARESDPSNVVTFIIEVAPPNPPGSLSVS